MVLMCEPVKLHLRLECWMKDWYEYSSEDKESKHYDDFDELKEIIEEMKKQNV